MKINKIKTHKKGKIIAIIAAVLLIGGSAAAYFIVKNQSSQSGSTSDSTQSSGSSSTNSSNSTASGSTSNKGNDVNNSGSTTNAASSQDVKLVIVDASMYSGTFEVRAYANAIEDGTCTYLFTSGSNNFTKETAATAGSSTTSCATLDVPTSSFPSTGQWNLTITYKSKSGNYSGSIATSIEVS